MSLPPEQLSAAQARRIAVVAQGFGRSRPSARVSAARLNQMLERIAVLQVDSVNVLQRSHYLPLFSRLGPYRLEVLDEFANTAPRRMVEHWAHMASFTTPATHALLRPRMQRAREKPWDAAVRAEQEFPGLNDTVHRLIAERGPLTASAVREELGHARAAKIEWGWNWNAVRITLEQAFHAGTLASAGRNGAFERCYDLPERVLPEPWAHAWQSAPVETAEANRRLIAIAARAFGVATEPDLRDYFRMPGQSSRLAVAELVEAGRLVPVRVEGWSKPAYLDPDAEIPSRVSGSALVSPFDPLVWFRPRMVEIFGMHYRIEIYTPAAKRRFGYYVLPYLLGDRLVARVDLKTDRMAGVLRVQAAHLEPSENLGRRSAEEIAAALAADLVTMAQWLGVNSVEVTPIGDLSATLSGEVAKQ